MNWKKYLAECIGTMVTVVFGCGVAVAAGTGNVVAVIAVSLAFGLSLMAMIYAFGNISGCHVNPAVSLAMLMCRKMSVKDFIGYVVSQMIGAILGAAVVGLFFHTIKNLGGNVVSDFLINAYKGKGAALMIGLIVEIVLSFVFVLTVLEIGARKKLKPVGGLAIGGALTLVHILGTFLTGTSVNPARSFGPALLQAFGKSTEALKQIWIFIIGPLVGAIFAAVVFMIMESRKTDSEEQDFEYSPNENKN